MILTLQNISYRNEVISYISEDKIKEALLKIKSKSFYTIIGINEFNNNQDDTFIIKYDREKFYINMTVSDESEQLYEKCIRYIKEIKDEEKEK